MIHSPSPPELLADLERRRLQQRNGRLDQVLALQKYILVRVYLGGRERQGVCMRLLGGVHIEVEHTSSESIQMVKQNLGAMRM